MPSVQRGSVRRLPSGKVQLRYYDAAGKRRTGGIFPTKSAAFRHYRDVIEPRLLGMQRDLTLRELLDLYVARHESIRSPRTIATLRERMKRPLATYGDATLADLETMALDLAAWRATLPPRFAPKVMGASPGPRRRRPLAAARDESGGRRGAEPRGRSCARPCLQPGRASRDRRRAAYSLRGASRVRGGDRATPRGMGRARTAPRRPSSANSPRRAEERRRPDRARR
jgi:hypothetical protein